MPDLLIVNKKNFEEKKKQFIEGGLNKIHILSDFDRTLTKAFVNGEKTLSLISELRRRNYISEDYTKTARALADKYHPIEINTSIPQAERKKAMHEWWTKHFELLIKSGLNKKHLEQIIKEGIIQIREGTTELLDFLYKYNISLVIISSAGLGIDSISMFFKKYRKMYNNIYISSNVYKWDKNGNAKRVKEPIIHSMNKEETVVKDYPKIYKKIKDRKNILLLGDSIDDIDMVTGFNYKNIIKIGFLNENIEENLKAYKNVYDVIILNDGKMDYINKLLKEIIVDK